MHQNRFSASVRPSACVLDGVCHFRCRAADSGRRKSATAAERGLDVDGSGSAVDSDDDDDDEDTAWARHQRLKARFVAEMRERQRHEETAIQLQRNYDDLLRSHAEKEITIEQLRLGVVQRRRQWPEV